jgi:hypothetical protein
MSGTRQLLAVSFRNYARPIPAPVRTLSPAQDTCEQCHWPQKFHGEKIRRVYEYADDEKSTESVTTLQMHVGGGGQPPASGQGIHWHMNLANEVEYIATDDRRETIPWVRVKDQFGGVREYRVEGVTPEQLANGERRVMGCIDCHNRPSHGIAATPERAVDQRIAADALPRLLPFIRREAVKALKVTYASEEAASEGIARALRDFYRTEAPGASAPSTADVEKAVQATTAIYRRNVFPDMKVTFGTYPSHIGHVDSPGCFRCHDDEHKTREGKTISQDCETCHVIE